MTSIDYLLLLLPLSLLGPQELESWRGELAVALRPAPVASTLEGVEPITYLAPVRQRGE